MDVKPSALTAMYENVEAILELQHQEVLRSLFLVNETETPLFSTWCEMRKSKLIQAYGLSYHRHRVGCFCGGELEG